MSTDNVRIPQQGALSDLAGWIAGDLGSCKARLYVSNTPFIPTRVPGDYTEASFVGYAPVSSPAWGAPFINGGGMAETDSPALNWTFTGGSGTAQIFGVFITDSTGTKLLAVVPFQTPITLAPAQPTLTRIVQITCISQV